MDLLCHDIWIWLVNTWSYSNIHGDMRTMRKGPWSLVSYKYPWDGWSMPNGPWYLSCQKDLHLRKGPWVHTAHNLYSYFWFTRLMYKKYDHVVLGQNIVLCVHCQWWSFQPEQSRGSWHRDWVGRLSFYS